MAGGAEHHHPQELPQHQVRPHDLVYGSPVTGAWWCQACQSSDTLTVDVLYLDWGSHRAGDVGGVWRLNAIRRCLRCQPLGRRT